MLMFLAISEFKVAYQKRKRVIEFYNCDFDETNLLNILNCSIKLEPVNSKFHRVPTLVGQILRTRLLGPDSKCLLVIKNFLLPVISKKDF